VTNPSEPSTFADLVKAAAPITKDDAARRMAASEGREKPKASRQRKPKPAEAPSVGDLSAANEDAESIRRAFLKGGMAMAKSVGRAMT
jgi:hypothetical protein